MQITSEQFLFLVYVHTQQKWVEQKLYVSDLRQINTNFTQLLLWLFNVCVENNQNFYLIDASPKRLLYEEDPDHDDVSDIFPLDDEACGNAPDDAWIKVSLDVNWLEGELLKILALSPNQTGNEMIDDYWIGKVNDGIFVLDDEMSVASYIQGRNQIIETIAKSQDKNKLSIEKTPEQTILLKSLLMMVAETNSALHQFSIKSKGINAAIWPSVKLRQILSGQSENNPYTRLVSDIGLTVDLQNKTWCYKEGEPVNLSAAEAIDILIILMKRKLLTDRFMPHAELCKLLNRDDSGKGFKSKLNTAKDGLADTLEKITKEIATRDLIEVNGTRGYRFKPNVRVE